MRTIKEVIMGERLGIIPEMLRGRAAPKERTIYRSRPTMSRRYRIVSQMLANYDHHQEEKEKD